MVVSSSDTKHLDVKLHQSLCRQHLTVVASYFLLELLKISRDKTPPKGAPVQRASLCVWVSQKKKIGGGGAGLKVDSFLFLYSSDITSSRVQRVNLFRLPSSN